MVWGERYVGDGSRYSAATQRRMEREQEEEDAITARGVAWLDETFEPDSPYCVCHRFVAVSEFHEHALTCRALRREVA